MWAHGRNGTVVTRGRKRKKNDIRVNVEELQMRIKSLLPSCHIYLGSIGRFRDDKIRPQSSRYGTCVEVLIWLSIIVSCVETGEDTAIRSPSYGGEEHGSPEDVARVKGTKR